MDFTNSLTVQHLGASHLGLPILCYSFLPAQLVAPSKEGLARVLIIGGVHGDEVEGVACAKNLLQCYKQQAPENAVVYLLPELNPDGVLLKTRCNFRGVDLNRNLPTKDWSPEAFNERYPPGPFAGSEPENQILLQLIDTLKPHLMISLHSYKPLLNVNGNCIPEAQAISKLTGYQLEESIGYPTPGCLGTLGIERDIGTITYEIERGLSLDQVVKTHPLAVRAAVKVAGERFKNL